MLRFFAFQSFPGVIAALLLAACGGGGSGSPAKVVISSSAPTDGTTGVAYTGFTFSASGGSGSYSWTETGALPPGLSLSTAGTMSGTPVTAGTYSFTVTATDASNSSLTASKPFSVKIADSAIVINPTPPPTGTVGTLYPPFQFTTTAGLAPLVWSKTGPLPNLGVSLDGVLSGIPSGPGIFPITLNVRDALGQSAPSKSFTVRVSLARAAATFTPTSGSMTVPRWGHTATRLLSGNVLVAGGNVLVAGGATASAEVYDSAHERFTATIGPMAIARFGHTATFLGDSALANYGKVLITGGAGMTLSAELYDPNRSMFMGTGSMRVVRAGHTATLLRTGQVLVTGGGTASAELYDPQSGTFSPTGSMTVARAGHTATLLLDGSVLVAGGGALSAELYDPQSGTFTQTDSMSEVRTGHTATLLLPDGTVLIAGPDVTAELYKPAAKMFALVGDIPVDTLTHGPPAVAGSTASLRNDGTVMVAGGRFLTAGRRFPESLPGAALYATESEGFTVTGSLNHGRDGHTATVLADGAVLVIGGVAHLVPTRNEEIATVLSSAELFK